MRGFGTAVMHGGVAAIGAFLSVYLFESRQWRGARQFVPGLLVAMMLHSVFNQDVLSPAGSTAVTIAGLPVIFMAVFYFSERSLHRWLGGKLDATKRSQIMFMDRDDILNLFTVNNIPLPSAALPSESASLSDDIPF